MTAVFSHVTYISLKDSPETELMKFSNDKGLFRIRRLEGLLHVLKALVIAETTICLIRKSYPDALIHVAVKSTRYMFFSF